MNITLDKSKAFALRIIRLYKFLCESKNEFVMSKQLLRSGTSIGANAREAERGQSKADFYAKFNIALKEADETAYWLELLHESNYLDATQFKSIYADCEELIRLLVSITKTQKRGRSEECGVRSEECGVRSAEGGVRNAECGVRSAEGGIRNEK